MKIPAIVLVLVGLGLGATLLRDAVPIGQAQQQAQQGPTGPNAQVAITPLRESTSKLQNEQNTIDIVRKYEPGLVYVSTVSQVTTDDPFAQFYGGGGGQTQVQRGVGSGFFVNSQGDILTNFHVVQGATSITLRVQGSDATFKARVIGQAPQYDLALVRPQNIPAKLIRPIPLGDSSKLQVGQKAIAMGAPFGLDFSVTEGIVSAVNRSIPVGFQLNGSSQGIPQKTIQTDAAINPGNSGGPLLDSTGRVIGINTQILSPGTAQSGEGQSAGVGFAIPINVAKNLLPRLQQANGKVVPAPRIGVSAGLLAVNPQTGQPTSVGTSALTASAQRRYKLPDHGIIVAQVEPGSPAAAAGLKGGTQTQDFQNGRLTYGGDVIVGVDGQSVDALEDLQAALIDKQVGNTVKLKVWRNGQTRDVNIKLTNYSFSNVQ